LKEIGKSLQSFPKRMDDEYIYEYGTEKAEERYYRHFWLKVYTVDSLGHCAIQFHINKNTEEPEEGICRFSICAEASAINRLGKLFETFSELKHLEFRWSPKESELFEIHQIEGKLWQI
jgi:Mn-dependent DtxR family transcriptional regulator